MRTAWHAGLAVLVSLAIPAAPARAAGGPVTGSSGWTIQQTPDVGQFANSLTAVAALSAADVWAVGCANDRNGNCRTLTEHWNGTAWSVIPSPNRAGAAATQLTGVSADAPQDAWAVGQFIPPGASGGAFVMHWTGSAWHQVAFPSTEPPLAVAALASDDVWTAAGRHIEHWNGRAWSVTTIPAIRNLGNIQALAAVSPSDVWAVGETNDSSFRPHSIILHWNGSSWSVVPSPATGPFSQLFAVSATSASNAWAVGEHEPSNVAPLTEHWNGRSWAVVPSPPVGPGSELFGVAAISAAAAWAVGSHPVIGPTGTQARALAEHWTGSTWTLSAVPTQGFTSSVLNAVSAAPGTLVAAGSGVPPSGEGVTLAAQHAP